MLVQADSNLITNKTLTYTDASLIKPLYSHAYTGTGNFNNASNWNTSVSSSVQGYHQIPTLATANISIGKYTTASVPVASPGNCYLTDNRTVNDLSIQSTSTLTMNSNTQLTVNGNLYKYNPYLYPWS